MPGLREFRGALVQELFVGRARKESQEGICFPRGRKSKVERVVELQEPSFVAREVVVQVTYQSSTNRQSSRPTTTDLYLYKSTTSASD